MVRTVATVVVGKVLLDHSSAQGYCSQHSGMARRMVGKSQHQCWKLLTVSFQHAQVNMLEVLETGGVVGVALHQNQVRIDLENFFHRPFNFSHLVRTSRQK